jgi:GntR family transcriptional regulator, galactonate operon transcriptional repressor
MDQGRLEATSSRARSRARRPNLYARVVDELGRRIVRGDFAATGILPIEPQLAAELGVSRNLLREAVKVLASKGLVDVGPRSGTRVRGQPDWHLLDPDVLSWLDAAGARLERTFGLVEFRLIVEPPASYLAALRATEPDRRTIMATLEELEACIGQPELVPGRDTAFHRSILAAAHNPILSHLGSLISSLMQIQVLATTGRPGDFERGLQLHRELALAIGRGAATEAEEVSRRLVWMPYEDLGGRIACRPEQLLRSPVEALNGPSTRRRRGSSGR